MVTALTIEPCRNVAPAGPGHAQPQVRNQSELATRPSLARESIMRPDGAPDSFTPASTAANRTYTMTFTHVTTSDPIQAWTGSPTLSTPITKAAVTDVLTRRLYGGDKPVHPRFENNAQFHAFPRNRHGDQRVHALLAYAEDHAQLPSNRTRTLAQVALRRTASREQFLRRNNLAYSRSAYTLHSPYFAYCDAQRGSRAPHAIEVRLPASTPTTFALDLAREICETERSRAPMLEPLRVIDADQSWHIFNPPQAEHYVYAHVQEQLDDCARIDRTLPPLIAVDLQSDDADATRNFRSVGPRSAVLNELGHRRVNLRALRDSTRKTLVVLEEAQPECAKNG